MRFIRGNLILSVRYLFMQTSAPCSKSASQVPGLSHSLRKHESMRHRAQSRDRGPITRYRPDYETQEHAPPDAPVQLLGHVLGDLVQGHVARPLIHDLQALHKVTNIRSLC
jgi:hypothetical protein